MKQVVWGVRVDLVASGRVGSGRRTGTDSGPWFFQERMLGDVANPFADADRRGGGVCRVRCVRHLRRLPRPVRRAELRPAAELGRGGWLLAAGSRSHRRPHGRRPDFPSLREPRRRPECDAGSGSDAEPLRVKSAAAPAAPGPGRRRAFPVVRVERIGPLCLIRRASPQKISGVAGRRSDHWPWGVVALRARGLARGGVGLVVRDQVRQRGRFRG